jgi:hypothetical protein
VRNSTRTIIASAAAAASLIGAAGLTVASASAATHKVTTSTAVTQIRNRPDSGGNGYWGIDKFQRTLVLTYQGKSHDPALAATPYGYTAELADQGSFLDLPGQLTPNQGGHDLGRVLRPVQVGGPMNGTGYFAEFFSSVKANSPRQYLNLGVEYRENDRGSVTSPGFNPSSTWPKLAFPATAVFSAPLNEIQFDYTYTVPAYTTWTFTVVNGKAVKVAHLHKAQSWEDASWDSAGQIRSAGNITGR